MSKIWVLAPDFSGDGYGAPTRAYTSESDAVADWVKLGRGANELFEIELFDTAQEK